ncbi:MAG: DUF6612 family protein [Dehalococcoidia bacterium]
MTTRNLLALPLILLILSVFILTGCIEKQITQNELIERIATAQKDLKSYDFEMDMNIEMKGVQAGEKANATISNHTSGAIALADKKMRTKMAMAIKVPETKEEPAIFQQTDSELYMIDTTMYLNMGDTSGMPEGWYKLDIPLPLYPAMWESQAWVQQQINLLRDAADIKIVGEEKVSGVNCYKMDMRPDMKQLLNMYVKQVNGLPAGDMDPSEIDSALQDIKSASYTAWYEERTALPVKVKMVMDIESRQDDASIQMTMEINMRYKHINSHVSIELPPEAEDAQDMSELQ